MTIIPGNDTWMQQQNKLVRATFKRAVINNVNIGARTADIYFVENPQTLIRNVGIASNIDVTTITKGMQARVDTFDENSPNSMFISYVLGQVNPGSNFSKRFIDLTDVPASYKGLAGRIARVKATEDGMVLGIIADQGQQLVQTVDATGKKIVLITFTNPNFSVAFIGVKVAATRQSGSAGTFGDSAVFYRYLVIKNLSGVLSQMGLTQDVFTVRDQAAWDISFTITGNILYLNLLGANNNNISWNVEPEIISTDTVF